jgi:ABC-type uncharacterized transport system auxiliary subunit
MRLIMDNRHRILLAVILAFSTMMSACGGKQTPIP